MAATLVYENVTEDAQIQTGHLFEGRDFWVAQRVPHRTALLALIRANGGEIVQLEKQADWMIADHFRKDCPPGTISYEFIHKSIARGSILDPNDFPAGPKIGTAREPGSLVRPARFARYAFTPSEDRILYSWVKEAVASGVPMSGNELYKQLEQKVCMRVRIWSRCNADFIQYPRHTWQSWRNRYLKHLKNRPSSAFDVPDNAPPSPPSDQASKLAEISVAPKSGLIKNKDKVQETLIRDKMKGKEQSTIVEEYTVDQLAAMFTTEDWEELYAFVDHIDSFSNDRLSYETSWKEWAENKGSQTSEQWRQSYEKVVRPQWQQDPSSKRELIRTKVEKRHQDDSPSSIKSQRLGQIHDRITSVSHTMEPTPAKPLRRMVSNRLPSDSRLESSSAIQHKTPHYIGHSNESALKRARDEVGPNKEPGESIRPVKARRRISLSPTLAESEKLVNVVGTLEQPLGISSTTNSMQSSVEHQAQKEQVPDEIRNSEEGDEVASIVSKDSLTHAVALPWSRAVEDSTEDDLQSIASSMDSDQIAPLPRPSQIQEDDEDGDDVISSTPTPRATKTFAFDTQAILSSSQLPTEMSKLPQPLIGSSPPPHPESEASTTQSIEEFRRSLNGSEFKMQTKPHFTRLPQPTSPTPSATSEISATGSEDPDEPLSASEMEDFFAEQHALGFSDEFITKALKRTRFRPGLAITVLDAWKSGHSLPFQRGIWSLEDDEQVESGDGLSLAKLEKKHSLDGWGGITERLNFLSAWSRR